MSNKLMPGFSFFILIIGILFFTGCGGSEVKMGGGTVTYNGNTISLDVDSQDKALVSKTELLKGCLENWEDAKRFYEKYYKNGYPKVVLCGINPGKNGVFSEVIEHFGAEKFYKNFYVTNIS